MIGKPSTHIQFSLNCWCIHVRALTDSGHNVGAADIGIGGLNLGPRSMLAEDIEIAVSKVILYHRVYEEDSEPDSSLMTQAKTPKKPEPKTGDSDEATGDVVESGTKEKRNFFKEANDIAGDAKF